MVPTHDIGIIIVIVIVKINVTIIAVMTIIMVCDGGGIIGIHGKRSAVQIRRRVIQNRDFVMLVSLEISLLVLELRIKMEMEMMMILSV